MDGRTVSKVEVVFRPRDESNSRASPLTSRMLPLERRYRSIGRCHLATTDTVSSSSSLYS
jgi:hypothetical protein